MSTKNTLLIIDNDLKKILPLTDILSKNYTLHYSKSYMESISILASLHPDLVLLSLNSDQEVDGLSLLRLMKKEKHLPEMPIVILSDVFTDELAQQALEIGAIDFIEKSVNGKHLALKIRNWLDLKSNLFPFKKIASVQDLVETKNAKKILLLELEKKINDIITNGEHFTTLELAKHLNVSKATLERFAKKCFGMGLKQYVLLQKLQLSNMLLEQKGLSIKQICNLCGFKSAAQYSALYKKKFGHPPSEVHGKKNNIKTLYDIDQNN